MLYYFHSQINKKSQLFTNLDVIKYTEFRRKGEEDGFTITKSTKSVSYISNLMKLKQHLGEK